MEPVSGDPRDRQASRARHGQFVRIAALAAVAVSSLSLAAANASAGIIPGQGIDRVAIGSSEAAVARRLGRPDAVRPPSWWYRDSLEGEVGFDFSRHVNDISTMSPHQRTVRDVGPGSSAPRVRRAYPRAHCYRHPSAQWSLLCVLRSRYRRRLTETDFLFAGRLRRVDIYIVRPTQPGRA